ncbi:MAG TPA: hypothetical protein PK970_10180 [Hyphomicrobiaceae bacterium]|nr:hypothetical protein [Hyphomicrobiaceae bacterium]
MTLQSRIAAATRRPSAASTESDEEASRRWAKRKPAHNAAQIVFDGMTTPHPCVVRDISSTGAKIEILKSKVNSDASTSFLPTYFTLIVPTDRTSVDCQSMWRRGSFMGVRFLGAVRQLEKPAPRPSIRK